jgi:hypothetical protein
MSVLDSAGRAGLAIACLACLVGLAACQDTGGGRGGLSASTPRIDAPGVPIAIESIEGAPESVKVQLANALASEASARQIALVSRSDPAQYRVKGYLTAFPAEGGGTTLAFVWDVFDASNKRSHRIEGSSIAGAGGGADPWSGVDQATLRQIASQGMNEIAGFLVARASDPARVHTATNPGEAKPLGFVTQ